MKSISKQLAVLERDYSADAAPTDRYIDPANRDKEGKPKRYIVHMDVSEANKQGQKQRPRTAGFTNNPFDSFDDALKEAVTYANQHYGDKSKNKITVHAGTKGKNDGFVLIESKLAPTPADQSQYVIKLWVKYTDYYHGDPSEGLEASDGTGKVVVDFYNDWDITQPSNTQLYASADAAVMAMKRIANGLQRTHMSRKSTVVEIQGRGEPNGSALVIKDPRGVPRILIAIRGTDYAAQGKFPAASDTKNIANKREK